MRITYEFVPCLDVELELFGYRLDRGTRSRLSHALTIFRYWWAKQVKVWIAEIIEGPTSRHDHRISVASTEHATLEAVRIA